MFACNVWYVTKVGGRSLRTKTMYTYTHVIDNTWCVVISIATVLNSCPKEDTFNMLPPPYSYKYMSVADSFHCQ